MKSLLNIFLTIVIFATPGIIVYGFVCFFRWLDLLPSSANDFLFFTGDQNLTFKSLEKNLYIEVFSFWPNFLFIFFYLELIVVSKYSQKINVGLFNVYLKQDSAKSLKDNQNSYTNFIYKNFNFNISIISDITTLIDNYNRSKSALPMLIYLAGIFIFWICFSIFAPISNKVLPLITQNDTIRTIFGVIIIIFIWIICLKFPIFLTTITSLSSDKRKSLKMYFLERVRQFFKAHKLIYLDEQKVKNVSETDFVAKFFKAFGAMKISIDEAVVIQLEDNLRPILILDAYYNSGGKNATIRHFMVLVSDNPDDHFGHTVSYSKNSSVWNFKLGNRVTTESVVFDKKFDSFSENQIEARLALKTNVMQDMIDLENHCPDKTMFYFYDNKFIICVERKESLFEIDGKIDVKNIDLAASSIYNDLNLALNIYRNFWLSRKSWKSIKKQQEFTNILDQN